MVLRFMWHQQLLEGTIHLGSAAQQWLSGSWGLSSALDTVLSRRSAINHVAAAMTTVTTAVVAKVTAAAALLAQTARVAGAGRSAMPRPYP